MNRKNLDKKFGSQDLQISLATKFISRFTGLHGTATVAMAYLILDLWDCGLYWYQPSSLSLAQTSPMPPPFGQCSQFYLKRLALAIFFLCIIYNLWILKLPHQVDLCLLQLLPRHR